MKKNCKQNHTIYLYDNPFYDFANITTFRSSRRPHMIPTNKLRNSFKLFDFVSSLIQKIF